MSDGIVAGLLRQIAMLLDEAIVRLCRQEVSRSFLEAYLRISSEILDIDDLGS